MVVLVLSISLTKLEIQKVSYTLKTSHPTVICRVFIYLLLHLTDLETCSLNVYPRSKARPYTLLKSLKCTLDKY